MNEKQDIRRGRHCVFAMHVHLIFVTKYRRCVFDDDALNRLGQHFDRVLKDFSATLIEMTSSRA